MTSTFRIGLISDTHGLLRPEAIAFLQGCDHIVHAGDVGNLAVLQGLSALAPVSAVRGNNDQGLWADGLPETSLLHFGQLGIYLLHDLGVLKGERCSEDALVVVAGHSHKPGIAIREGVLFINPGSAGPRRFKLPVAVGEILIADGSVVVNIVQLSLEDDGNSTVLESCTHVFANNPTGGNAQP